MALRAGYKGVKNDMISAIKNLISLGVKSLGTMFNVSNSGVLTVKKATGSAAGIVQPDGTTITVINGVISAEGGGSTVTALYTNPESSHPSEVDLSSAWDSHKALIILTSDTDSTKHVSAAFYPCAVLNTSMAIGAGNESAFCWYSPSNTNDKTRLTYNAGNLNLVAIYAID